MAVSRNQLLTTFAFLEGLFPSLFTGFIIGLRIYVAATGRVPEKLQEWNEFHFEVSSIASGSGFLYVCLYMLYVIAKLLMAVHLWNYVVIKHETRRSKYVIWIVTTLLLSVIGFLLLNPLRSHHVYEIGIAFIFSALTSFISLATVVCVVLVRLVSCCVSQSLNGPGSYEDDLQVLRNRAIRSSIV